MDRPAFLSHLRLCTCHANSRRNLLIVQIVLSVIALILDELVSGVICGMLTPLELHVVLPAVA